MDKSLQAGAASPMTLDVLVPRAGETEETLEPLLDSLAIQQNVPDGAVGVVICNDGCAGLPDGFLSRYPFPARQVSIPKSGVSAARNACLDASGAGYVMFCDADDMLFHACGLWMVFREMEGGGFDSLASRFVEEGRDPATGKASYINRDFDSTFVHGKVHRRAFLETNGIRWNDSLTVHEDSYFNILCRTLAGERYKYLPEAFYLWKWRDGSVCRRDPKYILKTYGNMLDSNTALVNEFLHRGRRPDAEAYCANMVYDAYYTLNKDEWWADENAGYKDRVEGRFARYYGEFRGLFDSAPEDVKARAAMGVKTRMYGEGLVMEKITFADWISGIAARAGGGSPHISGTRAGGAGRCKGGV